MSHRLPLPFVMAIVLCATIASSSHAQMAHQQQNLDRLMQRFPNADADKDGKLTIEEAKAFNAAHPELRRNRRADGKGKARKATVGASDRCDKTADLWDWLFGQKRAAKYRM